MKYYYVGLICLLGLKVVGQEVRDSLITLGELKLLFASDEHQLNFENREKIDHFLNTLPQKFPISFNLSAHTDVVGSPEYNLELSRKRATSVDRYLRDSGLPEKQITTKYFGEEVPVSERDDFNRRVTVVAYISTTLVTLQGQVVDEEGRVGISSDVSVNTSYFESRVRTDSSGVFQLKAPLGDTVSIEVNAEGHFIETNRLLITEKHQKIKLRIPLPRIEMGRYYLFRNMNFLGDRSIMIRGSERSLFQLQRFMHENKDLCIEIAGHVNYPNADSVAFDSGEFNLSAARSYEVRKALKKDGIAEERMLSRGYGNWEMKFPQAQSPKETAANRRVEIGIIPCSRSKSEENHLITDAQRFHHPIVERKYHPKYMSYDLQYYSTAKKLAFGTQLQLMKEKGIDPSKFTYKEVFQAYPDLPIVKR